MGAVAYQLLFQEWAFDSVTGLQTKANLGVGGLDPVLGIGVPPIVLSVGGAAAVGALLRDRSSMDSKIVVAAAVFLGPPLANGVATKLGFNKKREEVA